MFNKNKPYIIAEIGLNHCGNINLAKTLIKNAKEERILHNIGYLCKILLINKFFTR